MNKELMIPPGDTIKELLEQNNLNVNDLTSFLGFTKTEMRDLLSGSIAIDNRIATCLQDFFGIEKSFWLNLERIYKEERVG